MKRALVLEDSVTAAMFAVKLLRRLGYAVIATNSAIAARGAASGPAFDLYLIDCGVPATVRGGSADGLVVAREVRQRFPLAYIVVWSADDRAEAAQAIGATFVLKDGNETERILEVLR